MSNESLSRIEAVRAEIPGFISGKRLAHTHAVEEECAALGALFCRFPTLFTEEDACRLRIAALLHDITKEKTHEEQLALCIRYRIPLTAFERCTPKVLHAKTAAALAEDVINRKFGTCVVTGDIRHAIYTHTTGAGQMSLMDKLLYLADYIEPTRTFDDCVALRRAFYDPIEKASETAEGLLLHLDRVLILSFDMTIRDLLERGALIDPETTAARNALLYTVH